VPLDFCEKLLDVLKSELAVPTDEPSRWDNFGSEMRKLVMVWGNQMQ
jgi:hypothetical protein